MKIIERADRPCGVPRSLADHEEAGRDHTAVPTVVLPGGRRIVGAVSLAEHRRRAVAA